MNEPPPGIAPTPPVPWDPPEGTNHLRRADQGDGPGAERTWAFILWGLGWGFLFPALWAAIVAYVWVVGDERRFWTALLTVTLGGAIWAVGLIVCAVCWGISAVLSR